MIRTAVGSGESGDLDLAVEVEDVA